MRLPSRDPSNNELRAHSLAPIRSCIACRKRENWTDLLRLVVIGDQVHPDPKNRLPGRGAWLHRKCFDVAVARKSFVRAFKSSTDVKVEILENFLKESSPIN